MITYNSQTAVIQLPHNNYVDKVLRSTSFEELWPLFINADSPSKEISESYAAFSNMKKICRVSDQTFLHIGDGSMARTAAIFALFSKSANWSIDPQLNMDKLQAWHKKFGILGVYFEKSKFEDVDVSKIPSEYSIICVHAHVDLMEVNEKFPNWRYLYTNPCCYPAKQTFSENYMRANSIYRIVQKIDLGILSERRVVEVYAKHTPHPDYEPDYHNCII